MAQNHNGTGPVAKGNAPIQPASKGDTAAPKLNSEVEMGTLPNDKGGQLDIMQLARVGDIPAMEKLFESSEYDATYSDDEGITPLHVSWISPSPTQPQGIALLGQTLD